MAENSQARKLGAVKYLKRRPEQTLNTLRNRSWESSITEYLRKSSAAGPRRDGCHAGSDKYRESCTASPEESRCGFK